MTYGADNWASAGLMPDPGRTTVSETYDNTTYTTEGGEPTTVAGFAVGKTSWWRFTPPSSGHIYFNTVGSNGDTVIGVYTGAAVNALTVQASDDQSGGSNTSAISAFAVTGGTLYSMQVGAFNGAVISTSKFLFRYAATPPNNNFASATDVVIPTNGATYTDGWWSSFGCNTEVGEPTSVTGVASALKSTMWHKYTPVSSGSVVIDTSGTTPMGIAGSTDTGLNLYTGSTLGGLTLVGSNDQDGANDTSKITFSVTGGVTYYIQVGTFGSAATAAMGYQLNVTGPATVSSTGETVGREHAETLVLVTPDDRAGRVHGEALVLPTPAGRLGREYVEVLTGSAPVTTIQVGTAYTEALLQTISRLQAAYAYAEVLTGDVSPPPMGWGITGQGNPN